MSNQMNRKTAGAANPFLAMAAYHPGLLLVLSGPAGTGKTTVACRLLDRHSSPSSRLFRSLSVTTRPPRPGEVGGVDYTFASKECFAEMASRGELLEQAELYGNYYGTPRDFVENRLHQGVDVLLILDPQGRQQLALSHAADLVSVFLLPPNLDELERRLRGRNQEDEMTIVRRLQAVNHEISQSESYDYVLVNDDPDATLESLDTILRAERLRRIRPAACDDWRPFESATNARP